MTPKERARRLDRAKIRMVLNLPFFAPGLAKLPVTFGACPMGTAHTDGKGIVWQPEWFDSLPDECLPTLLAHEVSHCLFGHPWRMPAGGNPRKWNIAIDHATNLMLKEFSDEQVAKGYADPFPFPKDKPPVMDAKFKGWHEERIYAALPDGDGGGSGGSGGKDKQPGGGFGEVMPQQPQPGTKAAEQARQDASDWRDTLIQSAMAQKMAGTLPGSLQTLVGEIFHPKVPWWDVLRSRLRELVNDDWDFMAPRQDFPESDFILPSLRSERVAGVVFGSDWSGSTVCCPGLVGRFHDEKQECLDSLQPSTLTDIGFDTQIGWERVYRPGDQISKEIKCGGGTDFRPFFARVGELNPAPKVVVVLTDMAGSFPDNPPDVPTIWVTWEPNAKAPFGEIIEVEA